MSPRVITWSVLLLFSVGCLVLIGWVMYSHLWIGYGFILVICLAVLLLWASNLIIGREPISEAEKQSIINEHECNIVELAESLGIDSTPETKEAVINDIIRECNAVLDVLKMKVQ